MHWNNEISATRLRLLRVMAGETQEESAKSLNISRSCLANYETGRRIPDAEMIASFAEHFRMKEQYFQGESSFDSAHSAVEQERELLKLMPEKGLLDIADVPTEGKIALLQLYSFLRKKHNEATSPV